MSEMSRLRWRCRRGMKELDVAMTAYLEKFYSQASEEDQAAFLRLMDTQDPELMNMVMGKIDAPDEQMERVLQTIRRAVTA
ncbi:MAG: succinate dehydrogenase assembly factor 2 [Granulosicoccaceae bacterium]